MGYWVYFRLVRRRYVHVLSYLCRALTFFQKAGVSYFCSLFQRNQKMRGRLWSLFTKNLQISAFQNRFIAHWSVNSAGCWRGINFALEIQTAHLNGIMKSFQVLSLSQHCQALFNYLWILLTTWWWRLFDLLLLDKNTSIIPQQCYCCWLCLLLTVWISFWYARLYILLFFFSGKDTRLSSDSTRSYNVYVPKFYPVVNIENITLKRFPLLAMSVPHGWARISVRYIRTCFLYCFQRLYN